MRLLLPGLLSLGLAFLSPGAYSADPTPQTGSMLSDAPPFADKILFSGRLLAEFYIERGYEPLWDADRARALLALAKDSSADGFDPDDFHASEIERLLDESALAPSSPSRMAADILLTDALLRYIHHFRYGKLNPRHISPGWIFVEKADAAGLKADLARVFAADEPAAELKAMLPDPVFYRNLKKGYVRQLAAARIGRGAPIPGGHNLTVGMADPRVPMIRERLVASDGLDSTAPGDPNRYDADLADAIKQLQKRSGLSADGVIGPNTLRVLNTPPEERLRKIRANLERMRWLYNDLPPDYLFVDVTAYELRLVRNHETAWSTRVIVGKPDSPTPMFRDELEHLVFNPTWSVPASIQKKMGGAPSSYQIIDRRTGRRVSGVDGSDHKRYRLVQPPGPKNALGQVKFMFPNGHAIYLHDTPARGLFSKTVRTYSHGCVRVKDPLTLAEQVLNRPSWGQSQIRHVIDRGQTRYVHLEDRLPVLLYYLTAVADDEGRVGFRPDVYELDAPLLAQLDEPAHRDRIAFRAPQPVPPGAADPKTESQKAGDADQSADAGASQPATGGDPARDPSPIDQAAPAGRAPAGQPTDKPPSAPPLKLATTADLGQLGEKRPADSIPAMTDPRLSSGREASRDSSARGPAGEAPLRSALPIPEG